MSTRRRALKLIGGGTVLAASAAGGFVVLNQPSSKARAAWRAAGQEREFRRRALSYAMLAPNPHNRQPWQVRLESDNALTLYCDLERRLPATDPYDRQITIGLGAFLELLSMAAAQDGYQATINAFPEGDNMASLDGRPVAHVTFKEAANVSPDPLFAHVLDRRSNRDSYHPEDIDVESLMALKTASNIYDVKAHVTGDTDLAAQLRELTWQAHKMESFTPAAHQESVDLMRFGRRETRANPDGIQFEGAFMTAAHMTGIISRETLADPESSAFKQGLDLFEDKAMSARAFAWLTNANATRTDQIKAGRAYVRLNLKATELGLAIHPWSQALQEYPEMAVLYEKVQGLIGGGETIQMLVRVGYADPVISAPRWPLDSFILA